MDIDPHEYVAPIGAVAGPLVGQVLSCTKRGGFFHVVLRDRHYRRVEVQTASFEADVGAWADFKGVVRKLAKFRREPTTYIRGAVKKLGTYNE